VNAQFDWRCCCVFSVAFAVARSMSRSPSRPPLSLLQRDRERISEPSVSRTKAFEGAQLKYNLSPLELWA